MAEKIAVIGLGNTLRRDDGIGITVLGSLLAHFKREGVEYLDFGTASFDLVYRLQQYDRALLIDAIDASLKPGALKIFELEKIKTSLKASAVSSHEMDLKSLFTLCRKLSIKTRIYVAGIQVKEVGYGESLTGALQEKKEEIVKKISVFIDTRLCV